MRRTAAVTLGAVALLGTLATPAQATVVAARGPGAAKMPNVTGKGLVAAEQALPHEVRVKLVDARGAERHVFWPANWKVCSQSPAPGRSLESGRVELRVVKKREQCP
jgi:beta-lactam-binding protein with PASTA domain